MDLYEYLAQKEPMHLSIGSVGLTGEEDEAIVYWEGRLLVVELRLPIGKNSFFGRYYVWPSNGVLWTTKGRIGTSCFSLNAYPLLNRPKFPANPPVE